VPILGEGKGMPVTLTLPRTVVELAKREAEKLGLTLDELFVEIVTRSLDPVDRAKKYVEASKDLLEQAKKELVEGNLRQAAEKLWGAAALAIKAHAYRKEGKRLSSHRELWEYKGRVVEDLGEWVRDAWAHVNNMHTCFYEGWCTREDVETALQQIERLVRGVEARVKNRE